MNSEAFTKKLIITSTFLICSLLGYSQSVEWLSGEESIVEGITYDPLGNSFTESGYTSITVAGTPYVSQGMSDIIVIKHDPAGNVLWATSVGGTDQEYAGDIVYDGYGNVWITGQYSGTFLAGSFTLPSNGGEDAFVVKLDAASGAVLYASNGGGSLDDDDGNDIEVDGAGNIYVIGDCASPDFIWSGFTHTVNGTYDVFVMKFNNAGVAQSLMTITGSGWEFTYCGSVDVAGNVYVGGITTSTTTVFNGTAVTTGSNNHYIAKFDPSGTYVWAAQYQGGGNITDIEVDPFGNVYLASGGPITSMGSLPLATPIGSNDAFIAKANNDGTWSWNQLFGGTGNDNGLAIACNANGDVFFTGEFDAIMTMGSFNLTAVGGLSGFVSKLDSSGAVKWALAGKGSGWPQRFRSVKANGSNELWLAGIGASYIVLGTDSVGMGIGFSAKLVDSANVMTGVVYTDLSNDGIKDPGEVGIPNVMLQLDGGNYISSSNVAGVYDMFTIIGNHSVTMPYLPLYHTLTTPTSQTANFTGIGETDTANHFGLYPTPNMNDLRIDMTNQGYPKAGYAHGYVITYKNVGTTTLNGTVTMNASLVTNFITSSPAATSQSGQTFTWNVGSLAPGTIGTIFMTFDTPVGAVLGDSVNASASISPIAGDVVPSDNSSNVNQTVNGPYDPNYKKVSVDTIYDMTGSSYLEYEIHFQNLGNAPSYNVLLTDTLDATYLELASMEIVSTSHSPMNLSIDNGNIAQFYYPNVMLPDSASDPLGSMGFVKFKIKQNGTLPVGSQIENFGDIFFDYNPAVRTNTATTIHLESLGIEDIDLNNLALYPNPVSTQLNLKLTKTSFVEYIRVLDLSGRIVYEIPVGQSINQHSLDISEIRYGTYIIEVKTESGTEVLKFQKL